LWRFSNHTYSLGYVFVCNFTFILQAAAAVIEAMKDDHLSEVDQQMLSSRGTRLLRSKGLSNDLKQKLGENIKEPLKDPPNVKIKAKSMQG
jgi:hypothetical protein